MDGVNRTIEFIRFQSLHRFTIPSSIDAHFSLSHNNTIFCLFVYTQCRRIIHKHARARKYSFEYKSQAQLIFFSPSPKKNIIMKIIRAHSHRFDIKKQEETHIAVVVCLCILMVGRYSVISIEFIYLC